MQQQVKIIQGCVEIEQKINDCVKEMNAKGWILSTITAFYSRQSNYILVFEKKDEHKKV